jgi:hypothetical protein
MGYALNVMKLAVSVALMVPLAIEVTVWLQQPPPPEPWQRFEQADVPPGNVEVRPPKVWPAAVWAIFASQGHRGRYGDETSFAARWAALPWEASFQMLMLKRELAR